MREALRSANAHFLEPDRMLANRTAQLGEMLVEDGHADDYAQLLNALSAVASEAGAKQAYGELCQHYFNLRHMGADKGEALRTLSERYRTRRLFR